MSEEITTLKNVDKMRRRFVKLKNRGDLLRLELETRDRWLEELKSNSSELTKKCERLEDQLRLLHGDGSEEISVVQFDESLKIHSHKGDEGLEEKSQATTELRSRCEMLEFYLKKSEENFEKHLEEEKQKSFELRARCAELEVRLKSSEKQVTVYKEQANHRIAWT